jgi:glycosyltransferase involved in cell wall biosynthesis
MSPLRILCLNYEYPPIGGGGGRACAGICEALAKTGHSVHVQTTGMKHLPRESTINGVEVHRNPAFRQREDTCSVPEMAAYLACSIIPTLTHIRRWKPNVIHAHFAVPTGALAWLVSVLTGIPYVLTAHLGDVPGGVPEQTDKLFKIVAPFTRPIWARASAVTAVSGFVARLAQDAYQRSPVIIPNGIPLDSRPTITRHDPARIVMVGRLSLQKNPLLAIHALAALKGTAWHCDIIGDGPLRAAVEAAIEDAGLVNRVTLRGWLDSAAVHAHMSHADILLMPSLSEGMPVAAVEALNHGLAIVCGKIPGMLDVVEDSINGLTLELTPLAFTKGLQQLLTHPETLHRMRTASSEKALSYDIMETSVAYAQILARAAKTSRD